MIFPALLAGMGKLGIGKAIGTSVAGGLVGKLFGSKGSTTTSENQLPEWLDKASQGAIGRAETLSNRAYTPYSGDRFAPLTDREQRAQGLADTSVGQYAPWLQESAGMVRRGSQSMLDADLDAYMNPFIKGALDPAARDTREYFGQQRQSDDAMVAQRGAFGGSRHGVIDQTRQNAEGRAVGDIYSTGYAGAFDRGVSNFFQDRDAQQRGAGQLAAFAETGQRMDRADQDSLYRAGGLTRELEQAGKDFDYMQFIENRDWDVNNLNVLLKALNSVPHGNMNRTTQPPGSPLAQGMGAVLAGSELLGSGLFGQSGTAGKVDKSGGKTATPPPPDNP